MSEMTGKAMYIFCCWISLVDVQKPACPDLYEVISRRGKKL